VRPRTSLREALSDPAMLGREPGAAGRQRHRSFTVYEYSIGGKWLALKPTDLSALLTEQIAHLRPLMCQAAVVAYWQTAVTGSDQICPLL
jgi:hypothetical protein